VNAFGFGGANAHVVLEATPSETIEVNAAEPIIPHTRGDLTPRSSELFVATADSREDLVQRIEVWNLTLPQMPKAELRDVAYTESLHCTQNAPFRLAIVARDVNDLTTKLKHVQNRLQKDASESWVEPEGTYFRAAPYAGKVAILFPGIGFPGLGSGLHRAHRRVVPAFSRSAAKH
jgi:acyl transferase domain-containing protein